jgi:hypothetical protein
MKGIPCQSSNEVAKGILKAYGTILAIAFTLAIALYCCGLLLIGVILSNT